MFSLYVQTLLFLIQLCCHSPITSEAKDGPLFLTPFIEDKKIEDGKRLARVSPFEWNGYTWNVTSFSGLLTVDKTEGSNMFFWYFPSEREPDKVPLIVWLNGFSTASSYGLFLQNGPYSTNYDFNLRPRETSWQKYFHVLYIDNPVGVGFSFTRTQRGYSQTFHQLTANLHSALSQFFKLFPQLEDHELYVAGLSMAGKYVTSFAHQIYERGSFNIKGIFLGNPLLDVDRQIEFSDYLLQHGFIDKRDKSETDRKIDEAKILLETGEYRKFYEYTMDFILADDSYLLRLTGLQSIFNYYDSYIDTTYYDQIIDSDVVKEAVHVGNASFDKGTAAMRRAVALLCESVTPFLEAMIEEIKMLFYVGQLDIACAYPMVADVLASLNWSGKVGYAEADRSKLYDDGGYLSGYLKNYKTLTDVLVLKAGHSAITDKPDQVLRLLLNFTKYHRFDGHSDINL